MFCVYFLGRYIAPTLRNSSNCILVPSVSLGTLSEVNAAAKREDAEIAAALQAGGSGDAPTATAAQGVTLPLHGLVAISCDVHGVNRCEICWSIGVFLPRARKRNRTWLTAGSFPLSKEVFETRCCSHCRVWLLLCPTGSRIFST